MDATCGAPPPALPVLAAGIPGDLKQFPHWLCWRWEWRKGHWTKPPVDAKTGGPGSHSDPRTWTTFPAALAFATRSGLPGVGISLTEDMGVVGGDLDKCVDASTGAIEPWAAAIVEMFGSYTTLSPSGTGLRIFAWGGLPEDGRRKGRIEVYRALRYLTITGHTVPGTSAEIATNQGAIDSLYRRVAPEPSHRAAGAVWGSPCTLGGSDLRSRAASGRIRRDTLALLDSPGKQGDSEVDMRVACGLIGAGLTADEALALILDSTRGASAADRKGTRHVDGYWRRTVEAAARHVGPVLELAGGPRMRVGDGAAAARRLMGMRAP